MRHPWRALQETTRRRLLTRTGAIFVILTIAMMRAGAPLKNAIAPHGIVSLELAWSAERARQILQGWSPDQHHVAAQGIRLDFTYILVYALALSLACALVADRAGERSPLLQRIAAFASWGVLVAGVLDVLENLAMMAELGQVGDLSSLGAASVLAGSAATLKFLLLTGCALTLVAGLLDHWRNRRPEAG